MIKDRWRHHQIPGWNQFAGRTTAAFQITRLFRDVFAQARQLELLHHQCITVLLEEKANGGDAQEADFAYITTAVRPQAGDGGEPVPDFPITTLLARDPGSAKTAVISSAVCSNAICRPPVSVSRDVTT